MAAVAALFAGVVLLLLCATGTGLLLRNTQRPLHDYFARLRSWWLVTLAMLLVIGTAPWTHGLLFMLLIAAALLECLRALWPRQRHLCLPALLWIAGGLGCLQYWLAHGSPVALLLFAWVLLLTQLNDIAQYFAGKAFGRHRITPVISPNKTWEGFAGGVAFSIGASGALSPLLLGLDLARALVMGALVGVGGFAGDILFSWLKRRAGIKDFGNVLPGQGGVLDRLDSATVTAPLVQLLLLIR